MSTGKAPSVPQFPPSPPVSPVFPCWWETVAASAAYSRLEGAVAVGRGGWARASCRSSQCFLANSDCPPGTSVGPLPPLVFGAPAPGRQQHSAVFRLEDGSRPACWPNLPPPLRGEQEQKKKGTRSAAFPAEIRLVKCLGDPGLIYWQPRARTLIGSVMARPRFAAQPWCRVGTAVHCHLPPLSGSPPLSFAVS